MRVATTAVMAAMGGVKAVAWAEVGWGSGEVRSVSVEAMLVAEVRAVVASVVAEVAAMAWVAEVKAAAVREAAVRATAAVKGTQRQCRSTATSESDQ